ncbi:MAG: PIN domain-containing protein [Candidatus Bathyarchaeia archaeon]|jgi:predicted nucleic acid-binding protein
MTSKYVIDAYAWIEYFRASEYGELAKKYIESPDSITPTIVISEISRKLQKEIELGNETPDGRLKRLEFISATSQVTELDFELAVTAGKTDCEMKKKAKDWRLADSIVLCTARSVKGKVVTGDEHFRDLEEVIFIKKII